MTSDASVFIDLEKSEQGKVTFGDKKYGKFTRVVKDGKDSSNSIEDVYLGDRLKFNRLSISQL